MYSLAKKFLFLLDPETSHYLSLNSLKLVHRLGLLRDKQYKAFPIKLAGLSFTNRVGLAAGLDKNADYVDALGALGFGFIEIGTVTPKAQSGNPKPRLFRLIKDKAIINRMGFNSKGADYVAGQLKQIAYKGVLGINIGKNRDTANEQASEDYLHCFRKLWPYASYMTINISSPNTKNLRELQSADALKALLSKLKAEQQLIKQQHNKYIPLFIKIAPDLTNEEVTDICNVIISEGMDGIIATNTTIKRTGLSDKKFANEAGGLSGQPLREASTNIVKQLRQHLPADFPLIASGGVMDKLSAAEKIAAGADLVQVYTGFIYSGPGLIEEIAGSGLTC